MYKTRSRNIQRAINKHGRRHRRKPLVAHFPKVAVEGIFRRWFHTEQEIWIVKPQPKSQPIYLKGRGQVSGLVKDERVRLWFRNGQWRGEKIPS